MPDMRRPSMKGGRRGVRTSLMVSVARERMDGLLGMAEKAIQGGNAERSRRYVDLARKIGMRYNVRLPLSARRQFCSECNSWYRYGSTSRPRLRDGKLVITCGVCHHVSRFPYLPRTDLSGAGRQGGVDQGPELVGAADEENEFADGETE